MLLSPPSTLLSATRHRYRHRCRAALITDSNSFEVGKLIATYGFINVTTYSGDSLPAAGALPTQDVGEGAVTIRLYQGRVGRGPLRGTPVTFKVYPGQNLGGGAEADMMAANEVRAHATLQSYPDECQNVQILLGGFETSTGEQWLAFRNDGNYTAADYAKSASDSMYRYGPSNLWNSIEKDIVMKLRRRFVSKLMQGTIRGLAHLHRRDLLHQSLGPASVVLK